MVETNLARPVSHPEEHYQQRCAPTRRVRAMTTIRRCCRSHETIPPPKSHERESFERSDHVRRTHATLPGVAHHLTRTAALTKVDGLPQLDAKAATSFTNT